MSEQRKINSALISVFNKDGLAPIVEELKRLGVKSKKGRFGENMKVSLINDGPTTIWLDSKN